MVRHPEIWEQFESRFKSLWLAELTLKDAFQWFEQALEYARALRPDITAWPSDNGRLEQDAHIQLLLRTRRVFSQVRPPA